MSKLSLEGDPDKFQLGSIVTKNSRSGITSNKRLLVIKRGHLYYYSNIPKSFTGYNIKMLEHFHELPKCSIEIINIIKINGFEPTSSYFSIEFESKNMMEREDIRKTLINQDYNFTPKNSKELVTWQFTCDNQIIKQRWVSALNALKEHYESEQAHMEKYFQTLQNVTQIVLEQPKSSFGSFSSNRSSLKVSPWRQSAIHRKSYNVMDNKYGIEMKQGSAKESNKVDFPAFLKKERSEGAINKEKYDFELIIQQSPSRNKIQETYKYSRPSSPKEKERSPPPVIQQQSQQEYSMPQTPFKENMAGELSEKEHYQKEIEIGLQQQSVFEMMVVREDKEASLNSDKSSPQSFHKQPSRRDLSFSVKPQRIDLFKRLDEVEPPQKSQTQQKHYTIVYTEPTIDSKSPITKREQSGGVSRNESLSVSSEKHSGGRSGSERIEGSEFEWLLGESCKGSIKFDLRLQIQKQLIGYIQFFKQKAMRGLSEWITSKAKEQFIYKTTEHSKRRLIVSVGKMTFKIAMLTTENMTVNGEPKIFFNEEGIKNLKREYKVYKNLFRMVIRKVRNDESLKIRVPLCVYMEYKGVVCLAFDQNPEDHTLQLSRSDNQWEKEKIVLTEQGYNLAWFSFKTMNNYLIAYVKTVGKSLEKDDQKLREYLKRIVSIGQKQKNHNIIFKSPINKEFLEIAKQENASTSLQSLQRYIKGLKIAKNLHGECTRQEITSALEYCLYAKQLRKVYRSAQGQIDQTHFFNLVFKQDPSIQHLLQQSNCHHQQPILGQLFSFIQYYFGIILEVDEKVYNEYLSAGPTSPCRKNLFLSSTINPIIRQLPTGELQIKESYHKLQLYVDTKHHLALAALEKKKQIYRITCETMSVEEKISIVYDEAAFHYSQSDFIGCIKKCKEYEQNCPRMYTKLFAVDLLMMKAYSEFSEADFTITLKKITALIEYNYGYEHSSLVNLFSLAAFYYLKLSSLHSNLLAFSIKLVKKAEEICIKHFGDTSQQYLDILLDLSKLYANVDGKISLKYVQQAKKLSQSHLLLASPQNIASILIYQADLHLKTGDFTASEASLVQAQAFVESKISNKTLKQLARMQFQFGRIAEKHEFCEEGIEKLWKMSQVQKMQALQCGCRLLLERGLWQVASLIDEDDSIRYEGKELLLMQIERQKLSHVNLWEMLQSWVYSKNRHLLTMLHFLINRLQ